MHAHPHPASPAAPGPSHVLRFDSLFHPGRGVAVLCATQVSGGMIMSA